MKLSALQTSAPPGTQVELFLTGGGTVGGLVLAVEQEVISIEVEGARRNVFIQDISSFTVLESRLPTADLPRSGKSLYDAEQSGLWGKTLQYRDEIRASFEASNGADTQRAAAIAEQLASEVISESQCDDRRIREVLIGVFKLVEHYRDLAAASGVDDDGVLLSRALVAINNALRAAAGSKLIEGFVDLYHLLIAIERYAPAFKNDTTFWNGCGENFRDAIKVGLQLLNDPETLFVWERNQHLRTNHYRHLAALCRAVVAYRFVDPADIENLEKDAERFERLTEGVVSAIPAAPGYGHITSFGPLPFGFIQTRDRRTLYFHLREVLTPELREAIQSADEAVDLPVDYDIEAPPDPGKQYDTAVRIRPPGSWCGEVQHVEPARDFGFIRLSDARSVHFSLHNWPETTQPPHPGLPVLCWPGSSSIGTKWTTKYIQLIEPIEASMSPNSEAHRVLKDASDARERGDIARARALLERAMDRSPTPQIVCSYAAMMKVIDADEAARIYARGFDIDETKKSAKLWEDAGVFAAQRGQLDNAIHYLDHALTLAREHPEQRGVKGVLMALGYALYRRGTDDDLQRADSCYQEAISLHGGWDAFRAKVPFSQVNRISALHAALVRRSPNGRYDERTQPSKVEAHHLIEEALNARDDGDITRARALFERGLRECPIPQVVLSYAAMMKAEDPDEAALIYERGLRIDEIAKSSKVWEDAGVFASQRGQFDNAVRYLNQALALARAHPERRGLKGVLQALGHVHYRRGTEESIRLADDYYQEAIQLHGGWESFHARAPLHQVNHVHAIQAALARLRSQTPTGKTAYAFLEASGLRLVDANTDAAAGYSDLVCEVTDSALRDDYRLGERIFVRLQLENANSPHPHDVENAALEAAAQSACDKSTALLIVPEVSVDLESRLRLRLDDTSDRRPLVIVPLAQRDLERAATPLQTLRDALGAYLYRRDLFPRVGIVTGAEFFGRQRVLAEINNLLLRGEPIGLFGLRRTGKTSVLQAVKERQREQGNVVLHADLLGSEQQVISWLLHSLADDLRNAVEAILPRDFHWDLAGRFPSFVSAGEFPISDAFFSDLQRVLQALQLNPLDRRPKIILVIDELEVLQGESSSRTFDLLRNARGLQNRYQGGFDYIVTAANPSICEKGQIDGRDNPVFNCIRPLYLEFLTPAECSEMICELGRGMGISFDQEAMRRVYAATAGHPFLTRWLCSIAAKLRPSRPLRLTANDIINAEGIYNRDRSGDDLQEIVDRLKRDYPVELGLLHQIAATHQPVPLRQLLSGSTDDQRRAIRHLLSYQLAAETDHGIVLRMELMRRWLTGSTAGLPISRSSQGFNDNAAQGYRRNGAPHLRSRSSARPHRKWPRRRFNRP